MSDRETQRILVVDDDPETVDIMRRLLAERGYEVETTVDPVEAQDLVTQKNYAVVLSDVLMPGISGHDLTRAVLETGKGTQVILMTAFASIDKVAAAYGIGASDYLLKPFDNLGEVADAVDRAVLRYHRWGRALRETWMSNGH